MAISSSTTNSVCSVCGAETASVHLGVQACRACTVFFRRTRDRTNPYECKSGGKCEGDSVPCKKCRFDKFTQLLKDKKMKRCSSKQPPLPVYDQQKDEESVIDKLRAAYRMVGLVRRTSELSMRDTDQREHPMAIALGEYSLHPTTTSQMSEASRVLASTLVEFATAAFEGFEELSSEDKWQLIKHFHKPFHIYDSCYRSNIAFPGKFTRHFNSYTSFLDVEHLEQFVRSSPENAHFDDAVRMSRFHLETNVRPCRIAMERFDPSEQEFLAMLGIQFWTIDLRKFYAQTGITEYGARIGELFCLNNLLSAKVESNKRNFEVFRLLDIFNDDSFVYSMQK
ncbi:hypothetical protein PRIPAC_84699 [Pristionchus pacificus]|uniref:Nuclear receptor n=1 Tax=Pristionchus pacificus TaxID=54126 RepID=A0A2A6CEC6_PRIPA|nr:hypothetical protein PRIPAC_84699 [Pristionchus pacificus]|eukprot:PDM76479.1 nuclear receptor [Pristionchus pacificus]